MQKRLTESKKYGKNREKIWWESKNSVPLQSQNAFRGVAQLV